MLGLLADHGLRVGEIATLTWTNVDMAAREMAYYRPKKGVTTRQRLTRGLYDALIAYADVYPLAKTNGTLIVASESYEPVLARRGLTYAGLQTRAQ